MQTETRTFELDGVTYRLRPNDMNYFAKIEELTEHRENALLGVRVNASSVLAVLYAAIWSDYAARDEEPPMSYRQFGSLINSEEKRERAVEVVAELLGLNTPEAEPDTGQTDPQPAPARRSRSRGATRSGRSTSASPSASSGG